MGTQNKKTKKPKTKGLKYWDDKLIGSSPPGVLNQYVKWRDSVRVYTDPDTGKDYPVAPCITCKKEVMKHNLQAGHWISRRHKMVAYDEHNLHAQCGYCNRYGNGEPQMHEDEMRIMYGDEEVDRIRGGLWKQNEKSPDELEALYNEYKGKLEVAKREALMRG